MPTEIEPVDPLSVYPKPSAVLDEDDIIEIPELDDGPPPPDVTHIIKKINKRLTGQWQQNEIRCGRSFVVGHEFNVDEIKEVIKTFSSTKWNVKVSKEPKRGIIISFKPPEPEKKKPRDTRSHGGYL